RRRSEVAPVRAFRSIRPVRARADGPTRPTGNRPRPDVLRTGRSKDPHDAPPAEPLSREVLFRLVGPLVGVVLATILSGATGVSPLQHPGPVLWAAAVIATTVAGVAFLPWRRLPVFVSVVPPVAFVAASLLIRQAAGGDAGYDLLILLPVVWTAVYAQVLELLVVLASVAAARLALQVGTSAAPEGSARSLFVVATAAFLGLVVHQV